MSHYQVSISRHTDALTAVREALDLLGGMAQFVAPGARVLIKPNCVIQTYCPGTVTSAVVTAALAKLALEAGGVPVIGENNLVYDPSSPKFEESCGKQYHEALAALGIADSVPLIDLMQDEMVEVEIPGARVFTRARVAKTALTVDTFIDVPVMKTHDQTQVTLGIKNLKGVLPLAERKRSHEESVEQAIVDLCSLLKPHLVVIDGTTAAEGMGPVGGSPVPMDLIIAGGNALATDMVGAAVMGFAVEQIKFLKYAIATGLGPKRLEEIDVLGLPIDAVQRPFETAESVVCRQYREMGVEVVSHNVCSGCWAEFRHIYYALGEERAKLEGLTFALGRLEELPPSDKLVVVGNCARKVAGCGRFVPGCPPHHFDIDAAAREVSGMGGEPKKL